MHPPSRWDVNITLQWQTAAHRVWTSRHHIVCLYYKDSLYNFAFNRLRQTLCFTMETRQQSRFCTLWFCRSSRNSQRWIHRFGPRNWKYVYTLQLKYTFHSLVYLSKISTFLYVNVVTYLVLDFWLSWKSNLKSMALTLALILELVDILDKEKPA